MSEQTCASCQFFEPRPWTDTGICHLRLPTWLRVQRVHVASPKDVCDFWRLDADIENVP